MRAARRAAGLSQEELARKIGVSVFTVSRLERGAAKNVTVAKLVAIARAIDATPADLLGEEGSAAA